jgi:hypothetical protein
VEKNESFVGKFHYCRSVEIYKPVWLICTKVTHSR